MNTKFYLPCFNKYNLRFFDFMKENKEFFMDNISIGGVYDCFPGMCWNGGRVVPKIGIDFDVIKTIIDEYNDRNIPLKFTLTNVLLKKKDLDDLYCNKILEYADSKEINEAIVNSPLVERYIRKNFPNMKIVSSTTKCIRDIHKIEHMAKKYHLVVVDYRDNNLDFLSRLDNKDNIEILLNAYCTPDCTKRLEHYESLSKNQLSPTFDNKENLDCPCMYQSFWEALRYDSVIKKDDLYNNLIPMGYSNFKIEGRTNNVIDVIDSLVYYLVKPQYENMIRNELLKMVIMPQIPVQLEQNNILQR